MRVLKRDLLPAAHIGMHFSAQLTPLRICTADDESHRKIQAIHRIEDVSRSFGSPAKLNFHLKGERLGGPLASLATSPSRPLHSARNCFVDHNRCGVVLLRGPPRKM